MRRLVNGGMNFSSLNPNRTITKENPMTKTATAKNLSKTFPKKPASQSEKDAKSLSAKLAKLRCATEIAVPDATIIAKKSSKDILAAQVVELTKELNVANKIVEKLEISAVLAEHNEKIAVRNLREFKKAVKV